jgi:DNA-binding NarL/FixJ family response regulator
MLEMFENWRAARTALPWGPSVCRVIQCIRCEESYEKPVRVLLVDDHTLFHESLVRPLNAETYFQVVEHCATVAEALQHLSAKAVDVVLLDYDLGEAFGTDFLRELRERQSNLKVLMVTAGMRDTATLAALNMGASGVILKHSGAGQLAEALRIVAMGGMWLHTGVLRSLNPVATENPKPVQGGGSLSKRQANILRGILDDLTNKEIGGRLQVSEAAVKAGIQELFNKAGVRTRGQLVKVAIEKYSAEWLDDSGARSSRSTLR